MKILDFIIPYLVIFFIWILIAAFVFGSFGLLTPPEFRAMFYRAIPLTGILASLMLGTLYNVCLKGKSK